MTTLAHLSDLHLGHGDAAVQSLTSVVECAARADVVVVTGDLTEGGRRSELATFERITEPLRDRLVVLPGNHDRCGDDVGAQLMGGARVDTVRRSGCTIVRIDSTAPHNRIFWLSHGRLCERVLEEVDAALTRAPADELIVVALHHHLVPLPAEGFWEHVSELLFLPNHTELGLGRQLLKVVRGRADLVLHGHRHVPRQFVIDADGARPLRVYNAGSTTELGAFRTFRSEGACLREAPEWVHAGPAPRPSPHVRHAAPLALTLA
jgi:3',5'-cyclic AMP phosphodiesterase CpdA